MAHTQVFDAPSFRPKLAERQHSASRPATAIQLMRRNLPRLTWGLAAILLRSAYHLEVEGRERIPRRGPCVFAANHSSHLDLFALASQLPRERRSATVPMAAADYFFRNRALSALSSGVLNAVPLRRDVGHRHELAYLRHQLRQPGSDWSYIMFPEGTRSRNGRLQEFRSGIGTLVAESDVPVVPCHISGAFEAWPAGSKLPCPRGKVRVHFGVPVRFRHLPNKRSGWNQVAEQLHDEVEALTA